MCEYMIDVGKRAPKFELLGSDEKMHKLEEFKSKYLVVYFYPKDLTPGCTIEANEFSKNMDKFKALGADVVGVSNDDIKSHQKFVKKCDLNFLLLSDKDNKMIKEYESYGSRGIFGIGTLRNTYIIKKGIIVKSFEKVSPKEHIQQVLEALRELG